MRTDETLPLATAESEAEAGRAELLCLLRLHQIVLASPAPVAGLRAMVDEIVRLPATFRAVFAVPEGADGRLRYLAHFGLPEVRPHSAFVRMPPPMAATAMATGELIQLMRSDGGPFHACVVVPISAGGRRLGIFGFGMHGPVPIEPWREEMAWAIADLAALTLLNHRSPAAPRGDGSRLKSLTRRQREVLYELVERGVGNAELGERFGLSARTIKIHLMAAYRELGVRSRGDAIRMVLTEHGDWLAQERASRGERPHAG